MDGFLISIHLHAKGAPCKRMFRIARNFDCLSLFDFNQKPASIRAVIRTNRAFYLFWHEECPLSPFIFPTPRIYNTPMFTSTSQWQIRDFTIFISVDLNIQIT
jgi:hypothetical protein